MGVKVVSDGLPFGVYVATNDEGKYIVDEDMNMLSIQAMKGDLKKINQLVSAAKSCGIENPGVEFWEGSRKINDEEYEEQIDRQRNGLVPDKYDIGNLIEQYKYGNL